MPLDLFPAQQLIKISAVHRIGFQQSGGDELQPILVLPKICLDLVHDAGRVINSDFPAEVVRQQQLVGFGRYDS
jgi:hypothetical protein